MKKNLVFLAILPIIFIPNQANGATPFFANDRFTSNGVEWCHENQPLYEILGDEFFEHHNHSIESRICANLIEDPLWTYDGPDRVEKLIERSYYFTQLEISESVFEAQEGVIDTNPVEIPLERDKNTPIQNNTMNYSEKMPIQNNTIDNDEKTENLEKGDEQKAEDISEENGGCLIATATFGSELAPQVQMLREIRDHTVLQTESGSAFLTGFNKFYYTFSPAIADWERENETFKESVKIVLTPLLTSLSILSYVDVSSEEEMLGYGIGIISLNIGMYFVFPAIVIFQIKKRL